MTKASFPLAPALSLAVVFALGAGLWASALTSGPEAAPADMAELGERLFFDVNLSRNRTQSCATCHDPDRAFADPRGAASIGDDGLSVGDRNAPTATYASFVPAFETDADGLWIGGLFHDGRAGTLEAQAGGPPLNPVEMGMPDKAAVAERLRSDPGYAAAFPAIFGAPVLKDPDTAYDAMTRAIAAFERRPDFAPFSSKYDRMLRGEAEFTRQEELGRLLFFSRQFTNCNQCHQLRQSAIDPQETFSDYRYYNLGVPENHDLRGRNGVTVLDEGLARNPGVSAAAASRGRYRTPTLRNVAVTAPYMHNGVFEDLRTVILFYNTYNTRNETRKINPETGAPFGPPEVPENIEIDKLTDGPALDDQRIDALVAFLGTLTDERYEDLLD
ncbi:methylamine utilization protein MauG [Salipiger aestuarii]|uniref:Cytochrome c peroxidase n=1 Tax=Salipiger aestuarii TaxID=568098 RepID=A0A327XLN2_9RHOB|nr:cytochrome c peroxidase [Salipiger aestuarii]KAB2533155.1 methylamine utilization protein MauG [Salipiger aestuarii]RAK08085.1 cytochrome c peroxidase [Salipiger aestuarii]